VAIETVSKAGLDQEALQRYIERASPPDRDQRLARISSALENLPPVVSIASPDEFTSVQQIVRGLTKPPDRSARVPSLRNPRVP
jgi:hypothetical protein